MCTHRASLHHGVITETHVRAPFAIVATQVCRLPIIKVLLPPPFPIFVTHHKSLSLGVKVRTSHVNVGAIEIWQLPGGEFLRTSAICLHV